MTTLTKDTKTKEEIKEERTRETIPDPFKSPLMKVNQFSMIITKSMTSNN